MLVLGRKRNEGILITGPARIVVVDIHEKMVRLGFQADRSVSILRDEVADDVRRRMIAGENLCKIEADMDDAVRRSM